MKFKTSNLNHQEIILLKNVLESQNAGTFFIPETEVDQNTFKIFEEKRNDLNNGIPLDYLLENFELISGIKMQVRPGVFLPREETEEWLDKFETEFKEKLGKLENLIAIDYGCGSGVISLYLEKMSIFKDIISCDLNKKALETTKQNFLKNGFKLPKLIETSKFYKTEILGELKPDKDWVFISNPPYVPETDRPKAKEFRIDKEPEEAIYSGKDGLDLFKKLVLEIKKVVLEDGIKKPQIILFELDPRNIQEAKNFFENNLNNIFKLEGKYKVEIWKDLNRFERVLVAKN